MSSVTDDNLADLETKMIHFSGPGLVPAPRTRQLVATPVLGDLGKPTMRGIRKCPKCGTYNGTRGLSCKNKQCDMVFKVEMVFFA